MKNVQNLIVFDQRGNSIKQNFHESTSFGKTVLSFKECRNLEKFPARRSSKKIQSKHCFEEKNHFIFCTTTPNLKITNLTYSTTPTAENSTPTTQADTETHPFLHQIEATLSRSD